MQGIIQDKSVQRDSQHNNKMKFIILTVAFIGAASAGYISPAPLLGGYSAPGFAPSLAPALAPGLAPAAYSAPLIKSAYAAPALAAGPLAYSSPIIKQAAIAAPAYGGYGYSSWGGYAASPYGLWKKKASA